jgi:hypothetical protein
VVTNVEHKKMKSYMVSQFAGIAFVENLAKIKTAAAFEKYINSHKIAENSKVILGEDEGEAGEKYEIVPGSFNQALWSKIGEFEYRKIAASFERLVSPFTHLRLKGHKVFGYYTNGQISKIVVVESDSQK